MSKKSIVWIATPALALAAEAAAFDVGSIPPSEPNMRGVQPSLSSPPRLNLFLGTIAIHLGDTSLSAIVKTVGVGRVLRSGDAGESRSWLCYRLSPFWNSASLWLVSGELNGVEKEIDSIQMSALPRRIRNPSDCPVLPEAFKLRLSQSSVSLGQTGATIGKLLGPPSAERNGWTLYSHIGPASAPGFETATLAGVQFKHGVVNQVFFSQATSN